MDLGITVIDLSGKAFIYNWDNGQVYYMNNADAEIQLVKDIDFHPVNAQSMIIFDKNLYQGKSFKKLKDVQKFVAKTTYEQRIKSLKAGLIDVSDKYARERIKENIQIYRKKIETLN